MKVTSVPPPTPSISAPTGDAMASGDTPLNFLKEHRRKDTQMKNRDDPLKKLKFSVLKSYAVNGAPCINWGV